MPKFFTARENISDKEIRIDSEDAKHIKRVLRLSEGDTITVCDGRGIDYEAAIREIYDNCVICSILSSRACNTEPKVHVTLYQGIPKAAKMDYIIQKTTELGISRIVPVKLARCVVKLDGTDAKKKTERWRRIAYEASKQCGRGVVPEIEEPVTIHDAVSEMLGMDLAFAPFECETDARLRDIAEDINIKTAAFIIGPEGGFDPSEINILRENNLRTITLGRRILRTETAGEAVLAMLMYALREI